MCLLTNDFSEETFEAFIRELHTKARTHPMMTRDAAEIRTALECGDLWPLWRDRNSPEVVVESDGLESGLFLEHGKPPGMARAALADWRARNLLMGGRLRAVTGAYPGGRVLALVGHAHKGPLEAALATDQWDLEVADNSELDG